MFYPDVFAVINCIVDSVSLYVDDVYVGEIVRKTDVNVQPPFTGEEVPLYIQGSQKPFVKDFVIGQHSFYAKMKGDCSNHWKGTFKIEKNKTYRNIFIKHRIYNNKGHCYEKSFYYVVRK